MDTLSYFMLHIATDPDLKNNFVSCLDQYVLYGNKGRHIQLENQMKMKLAEFNFQGILRSFLQDESFFVHLYNCSKKYWSKQYTIHNLHETQNKLQKIISSVDQLLEEKENWNTYDPAIDFFRINEYCDKINQFDDPFLKRTKKKKH